jgi:FKBP-type peptidyl-prolyl cis-trans isomerase (trigger factor)
LHQKQIYVRSNRTKKGAHLSIQTSTNQSHEHHRVFPLQAEFHQKSPTLLIACITVPEPLVTSLYNQASLSQKNVTETQGFAKGQVPLDYIQESFKTNLIEHLQEFLFTYCVTPFLQEELRSNRILMTGEPRLIKVNVDPHTQARYDFEISVVQPPEIQDWKYLPFRAPKRKNYKDLDRQVEMFINEEKEKLDHMRNTSIGIGDWVMLTVSLLDADGLSALGSHKVTFWLRVGDEEADLSFKDLVYQKQIGATFTTQNRALQEYFSDCIDTSYTFLVEIVDCVKNDYFCTETFKRQFKIKTNKLLYQKLIEVFSYRNDISLRRAMVQDALQLLLSKHPISIPSHLILRQEQKILDTIKDKPDYQVYRTQKDFKQRVQQLAEKQVREMLFLDQLAYEEKLTATNEDIRQYLNLSLRPRTKEFIYFDPPITKQQGQEIPISHPELQQYCLREKTINHIIYHLTKK